MSTTTQYKPLPPWSEMPDWAKFRAVDSDGELFIYECRPERIETQFDICNQFDMFEKIGPGYDPTGWENSLEARPENDAPVLVPDSYRIEGSNDKVFLADGLWYIFVAAKGCSMPVKGFPSPTAAAAYWLAVNKNK